MFSNGQALISSNQVNAVFGLRQGMEDDFGIIPFPKYDDSERINLTARRPAPVMQFR